MRFELSYEIFHQVVAPRTENSFDLWTRTREQCIHTLTYDKFSIDQAAQEFDCFTISMDRMNNRGVFITWIECNSVCVAPFVNPSAADMHFASNVFIICGTIKSFEDCQIVGKLRVLASC